jgi:hypothetical protein
VQVVDSAYAVFSLWAAHHGGEPVADVDQPQTALVLRCGLEVEIVCIPTAAGRFITALQSGHTLLAAASADPTLDLPATLALLVRQQLITHLTFED